MTHSEIIEIIPPAPAIDPKDWKVADLKAECKRLGVAVSGKKADLVERINHRLANAVPGTLQAPVKPAPTTQPGSPEVSPELVAQGRELTASIQKFVDSLKITNDDEYEVAAQFLSYRIKGAKKFWDAAIKPITKDWHTGWKKSLAIHKTIDGPLTDLEREVKRRMAGYLEEKKKAKQAEYEEEMRRANVLAQELAITKALELAEEGRDEEAQQLLSGGGEQPASPPPTLAAPESNYAEERVLKRFKVVGEVNREYLIPDAKKIQALVNRVDAKTNGLTKQEVEQMVGGIEVKFVTSIASRNA